MTGSWSDTYGSWGRTLRARHCVERPATLEVARTAVQSQSDLTLLGRGCGRSYGDVPLNPDGRLIDCGALDRFIAFDRETGVLVAEAGVQLGEILSVTSRPEVSGGGWLLPVTPGTRFVTLGGAVANDVHGKNHHSAGTFGRHVLSFELARSDGEVLRCSPAAHAELFAATIGGLGLTGLILTVALQLRHVDGLAVEGEDIRFDSLDAFFALSAKSEQNWEYAAAWIDCLASGAALGRGIFSRGRHVAGHMLLLPPPTPKISVPFTPPVSLVAPWSLKLANALYFRKLGRSGRRRVIGSYEPVFYPLDALGGWNRLYGPKGFYQFQCVVPPDDAKAVVTKLLQEVAKAGEGSLLAVLKVFGDMPSPGLLSFPMAGTTLALDFPARGASTLRLLGKLEEIVIDAGGRIYPAKDSVMSAKSFAAGYPELERFRASIDPRFASGFARRVGLIEKLDRAP